MSASRGFTLIELLVVIAVISLLAALVMPVIQSALLSAERTTCLNNIHQLHSAIMAYVSGHNGFYPDVDYRGEARWPTPNHCWNPVFNEEIDRLGQKVKFCPANEYTEWHVRQGRAWGIYSMGYCIYSGRSSSYYTEQAGTTTLLTGRKASKSAPGAVMITDLVRTWDGMWIRESIRINNHINEATFVPLGGHCGFADGHTRWTAGDDLDWTRYYQEYPSFPVDRGWTFCLGFRQ